jgi:hypothetical protein
MKSLIISLISTFIILSANAQIQTIWDETYGGENQEEALSLIQLKDGNLLVVGFTMSQGAGKKDGYAAKISPTGEQIWDMTYGGVKNDFLNDVVELPNGMLAFVGATESNGAGDFDFWFIMADADGNLKWEKTYGGEKEDEATDIVLSIDGKLVITGFTKSRGAGNRDIYMIKIDHEAIGKDQGKEIWKRNAGGDKADFASEVVQNQRDSALICIGTTTSYGVGSGDIYVIRVLDNRGQIKGKKTVGGKQYEYGNGIVLTDEEGFFIVGASMTESAGLFDGFVTRLNEEFDSYFEKTIGGEKDDFFTSVVSAKSNFLIVGYTASQGEGESDGWLILMDEKGNIITETTVGESKTEKIYKIIKAKDGSFYFCGTNTSKGNGSSDFWVVNLKLEK